MGGWDTGQTSTRQTKKVTMTTRTPPLTQSPSKFSASFVPHPGINNTSTLHINNGTSSLHTWLNLGIISNFISRTPTGTFASVPTPFISIEFRRQPVSAAKIVLHFKLCEPTKFFSPLAFVLISKICIWSGTDNKLTASAILLLSFWSSSKNPEIKRWHSGQVSFTDKAFIPLLCSCLIIILSSVSCQTSASSMILPNMTGFFGYYAFLLYIVIPDQ